MLRGMTSVYFQTDSVGCMIALLSIVLMIFFSSDISESLFLF